MFCSVLSYYQYQEVPNEMNQERTKFCISDFLSDNGMRIGEEATQAVVPEMSPSKLPNYQMAVKIREEDSQFG